VLIIVPSSETKREPPVRGRPVSLDTLSFPALTEVRTRILDALIATSAQPDALRRLLAGDSLDNEVDRNTHLRGLPVRPALEVYTGTLHAGLDAATLSPAAARRARSRLVIVSALWGLLRPADRIPPYRMNVCARLIGMEPLEPTWRTVIPDALAGAAGGRGVILDLRSASYQALGMPTGLADRIVTLRVDRHRLREARPRAGRATPARVGCGSAHAGGTRRGHGPALARSPRRAGAAGQAVDAGPACVRLRTVSRVDRDSQPCRGSLRRGRRARA